MNLIIAEKPSLGKMIAEAIGGGTKPGKMSIELENGDIVCWAAGHIFEQASPEKYDKKYEKWSLEDLPIVPAEWKIEPKESAKDLYENIKRLLTKTNHVINAGDADREGQLLIDEILEYLDYKGRISRLWINNPTVEGIRKAFREMKDNSYYRGFRGAALGRSRSDWLLGINLTRGFSKKLNGRTVSMGRVQTPTLAFVVERDRAIESFVETPFYEVYGQCVTAGGEFRVKWIPDENRVSLDEQGRLLDRIAAERFAGEINGGIGHISKADRKETKTSPPLAYKISDLQADSSKEHDLAPARTLEILQSLYEARLVTYPRSDCPYLPEGLFGERERTMETIGRVLPELKDAIKAADLSRRSKTWNDEKLAEHHGIIPTGVLPRQPLSAEGLKVYELLSRRYVAQFMEDQRHDTYTVEASIKNELFRRSGKREISPGWHVLYAKQQKTHDKDDNLRDDMPAVAVGEPAAIRNATAETKKTTPPERYTEATLLNSMVNAHRYVKDPSVKKYLKDEGGIGTGATQGNIIKILFDRGYIEKEKKYIKSTELGRKVIEIAPEELRVPDMSALWEQNLKEIQSAHDGAGLEGFIKEAEAAATRLIQKLKEKDFDQSTREVFRSNSAPADNKGAAPCAACGKTMVMRDGKNGKFWACYACGMVVNDFRGRPGKLGKCPECGGFAARIKGKNGFFWACRNQKCKKTFSEKVIKALTAKK